MNELATWANILSPIIAVLIAIWVNHKSAKDTRKQIQGLKNLCIMQISNTLDMLEVELYKFTIGKEEDNSELKMLHEELLKLRESENANRHDIARLEHKMRQLNRSARYKNSFTLHIMNRQFALMRGIDNVKNMK
ncbi:MAG: hypothetical protein IJ145_09850 [Prevotella sp.]|nr:hypothetical protein [Prevotella sp.]